VRQSGGDRVPPIQSKHDNSSAEAQRVQRAQKYTDTDMTSEARQQARGNMAPT